MSILDAAIVYDIEAFPNVFTFSMEELNGDKKAVWEISDYRNDSQQLMQFLQHLSKHQTPMIGFNNLEYDYPMIHWLMQNPNATAQQIRAKNDELFSTFPKYKVRIWANKRYIPQIDLRFLHHLDNKAKMQSLKGLQINMRLPNVREMDLGFETPLTEEQVNTQAIPYNDHDVASTKTFAHHSMSAMIFRENLIPEYGVEVMSWNDTKIGEELIIKRLGDEICFDRSSGYRQKRQTPRFKIAFNDIIFPYVQFENPEFQKVLDQLRAKTIHAKEIDIDEDGTPSLKTKGVFKNLHAVVGGIKFGFGTGGIHGSVDRKRAFSTQTHIIRDIDVKSLYPSIAIVNRLAPEHLGQPFVDVYAQIPEERAVWQAKKGKKCNEANSLKLGANGGYGKSNSKFSVLFDPQFTMTITINGQLLLAMLIEKLVKVPSLQLIQANTDGITYFVERAQLPLVKKIEKDWENLTALVLEDAEYKSMFVRDVNGYIAEDIDGSLKLKGPYWTPDPTCWHESIANAQPPAWHKNLSNPVSARAAVAHMVYGVDIEQFIRACKNPYDFTNQKKINRSDHLYWGDLETQRNCRYYISTDGKDLVKVAKPKLPPGAKIGAPKKGRQATESEYLKVMNANGWQWDETVCTKNKSTYQIVHTNQAAGYKTTTANDIQNFSFDNVNYDWYIKEAQKLVV